MASKVAEGQDGRAVAGHRHHLGDHRLWTLQLNEIARTNPQADNVSLGLSYALDPSKKPRLTRSSETPEP